MISKINTNLLLWLQYYIQKALSYYFSLTPKQRLFLLLATIFVIVILSVLTIILSIRRTKRKIKHKSYTLSEPSDSTMVIENIKEKEKNSQKAQGQSETESESMNGR